MDKTREKASYSGVRLLAVRKAGLGKEKKRKLMLLNVELIAGYLDYNHTLRRDWKPITCANLTLYIALLPILVVVARVANAWKSRVEGVFVVVLAAPFALLFCSKT